MGLTTGWMDQEVHGWLDWTGLDFGICWKNGFGLELSCGFAVHGVGAWRFGGIGYPTMSCQLDGKWEWEILGSRAGLVAVLSNSDGERVIVADN
jgi:hypothetical protein